MSRRPRMNCIVNAAPTTPDAVAALVLLARTSTLLTVKLKTEFCHHRDGKKRHPELARVRAIDSNTRDSGKRDTTAVKRRTPGLRTW